MWERYQKGEFTGKIITELESEVDKVREREALKPDTALLAEDDFEFWFGEVLIAFHVFGLKIIEISIVIC